MAFLPIEGERSAAWVAEGRNAVIDTLSPLKLAPGSAAPAEAALDDLLIAWGEWSADPTAVAALGETTPDLEARIAVLEERLLAALPAESQPVLAALQALQRQRADEWGFSGVEFARRALVTLLR
jgi:hypothetical protein